MCVYIYVCVNSVCVCVREGEIMCAFVQVVSYTPSNAYAHMFGLDR